MSKSPSTGWRETYDEMGVSTDDHSRCVVEGPNYRRTHHPMKAAAPSWEEDR